VRLAAVAAVAWICAAVAPAPGPASPPAPGFTRESALAKLLSAYPQAKLPPDDVPPGVTAHLDLVYATPQDVAPLALDLFVPPGAGPHPVAIVVHGGGWETGDRRMERPFAVRLAAAGYAAAPVSYRLGPAGRFPNALADLRAAIRWLRAQAARYRLDTGRVGAVGGSAGGQLVALLGASNGEPDARGAELRAVVDIDGLADFTGAELVAKENRSPGAPTRFLGGSYSARAEVWRQASAIAHIGPRSAPTLFLNSTAPTPVLPGRPEMCARLRALGVDCAVVVVPDTPHPFWLVEPWFARAVDETTRFFGRHLR
jgi:pectinesterase